MGSDPDSLSSPSCRHTHGVRPHASSSDAEAFAAAAFPFDVRVAELERLVQAVLHEIHLGAVDEPQALRGDDHLYAGVVEHHVVGLQSIRVVDGIRPAVTAAATHAYSQAHAVAALVQITAYASRRAAGQRNRHNSNIPRYVRV